MKIHTYEGTLSVYTLHAPTPCYWEPDSWDVKDLQTIVLFNSEENHTYKRIGGEEMRAAIDHGRFSPKIYSRPQRSAVAHGINRKIVFD